MTVAEVISHVIIKLGGIEVPVMYMGTIGKKISECIVDLNACLNADNKEQAENSNGGENDAGDESTDVPAASHAE